MYHIKKRKPAYGRSRNRNSVSSFDYSFLDLLVTKATGASEVVPGSGVSTTLVQNTDEMHDTVTPGFEEFRANGGIINTPMRKSSSTYDSSASGFAAKNDSPTWPKYETYTLSLVSPTLWGIPSAPKDSLINIANMRNYASVKALAGMKPSSMQGLVSLVEMRKTFNMLLHPLQSVTTLLGYIVRQRQAGKNLKISNSLNSVTINGRVFTRRQPRYKGPGRIVTASKHNSVIPIGDAISGTVLANNLGLRPLMMDIDAILKEIPKLHSAERLTSRSTLTDTRTDSVSSTLYWSVFSFPVTITTTQTTKVRASVLYEDKFDVLQDFGVSPEDIFGAAWELIPYSFLVDYFVNVGELLEAFKGQNTRRILASTIVTTTDTVVERKFLGSNSGSPTFAVTQAASGSDTLTLHEKERQNHLETITLAYKPMTQVFRPTVIQNLLSLAVQQLTTLSKSRPRRFS